MNYDPLETCPYDTVHRIMRSRMQCHLVKCRKNWPCTNKKQCPYDARHIINEIEFNYHVSICPQRESVLRYKFVESTDIPQPKILPIDPTPLAAVSDENWEDDVKVKSYDPMKNTQNRPVIRQLEGAQKAQRKLYKNRERLRHSRLDDEVVTEHSSAVKSNNDPHAPGLMKATIPEETSVETEQEYKPLRRPKKLPLDTSKVSDSSTMNDSVAGIQHTIDQNKSLQLPVREKSNGKESKGMQPKEVHSYATALNRHNSSIESDYDVVIEGVKFDADKESNSSFLNNTTIDENLIKVSKTVEQLTIGDEGHKIQSASLDKTLESLKKTEKNYPELNGINNSNNDNNIFTKERRSLRCAANFTNSNCSK